MDSVRSHEASSDIMRTSNEINPKSLFSVDALKLKIPRNNTTTKASTFSIAP